MCSFLHPHRSDQQFETNFHSICGAQTLGNSLNVGLRAGYLSVHMAGGAFDRHWLKARLTNGLIYLLTYLLTYLFPFFFAFPYFLSFLPFFLPRRCFLKSSWRSASRRSGGLLDLPHRGPGQSEGRKCTSGVFRTQLVWRLQQTEQTVAKTKACIFWFVVIFLKLKILFRGCFDTQNSL